jgi:metal-responsive CopG/Arc/MetJ family transcriptional regulator
MEKEKAEKQMIVMVPPSLYRKFKDVAEADYKTISIVIRDFMINYIKEKK